MPHTVWLQPVEYKDGVTCRARGIDQSILDAWQNLDVLQSCSPWRINSKLACMSPSLSLCRIATSRLLRATALLAWLLMAISMPAASTGMMAGDMPANSGTASTAMVHAMHTGAMTMNGDHAGHCCGDHAHPACHCAAMCATALLPCVPVLHGPVRLAAIRVPVLAIAAPTPDLIPPLRPPAA